MNKGDAIIDIGGGSSVLVDHHAEDGFENLAVLDISGNALANARKRLGKLEKCIDWVETDITEFTPPHQYYLWHDRAVFHFLVDESDRSKYITILEQALIPQGHIIIRKSI